MTRILVTGAGGYIGSRLVEHLAAQPDVELRAAVRRPVSYLPDGTQVTLDLLGDETAMAHACDGVDAVVHLAGANDAVAAADPARALGETIEASRRLAAAVVTAGVGRLVYVSTVHVYGARIVDGMVLTEELVPEPRTIYATARLASEHLVGAAATVGVEVVVLRLSNSVGAPAAPAVDRWTLVASDLARQAVRTGRLVLRTSGLQWRDFVALGDVVEVLGRAATSSRPDPGTYNLGSGTPTTVRGLAELVAERFEARSGRRPELVAPPGDDVPPERYRLAVDRLAAQGFRPATPLADAVDELVGFCIDNEDRL
ncbi:MAG: NAD-dependent epimerase/dehydratase family protein [Acidimicrobiales bacterium]